MSDYLLRNVGGVIDLQELYEYVEYSEHPLREEVQRLISVAVYAKEAVEDPTAERFGALQRYLRGFSFRTSNGGTW